MKNVSRRRVLSSLASAGAFGLAPQVARGQEESGKTAPNPVIKVAGYDYDRCRAFIDGKAGIPGHDVRFTYEDIYSVNALAFGSEKTYEVTEMGLIPYINKFINGGFRDYTLIPIFISRIFRHRNVYVHTDSGIEKPEDLKGKRVGTPGYGMSANTWIRGFLLDEYGVKADDFEWIETTKSSDAGTLGGSGWMAFRNGKLGYYFPKGFPIRQGPQDMDESELLLSGGCDALITAITPKAVLDGNPKIRPLFRDVRATEQAYYEKTRMFPIMHVIAMRSDFVDANPELPAAVFRMYSAAKQAAYQNLETTTSLRVTLPWLTQELEDTRRVMGQDFWRYGLEANRKELEHVMRYVHEQHLVKERIGFETLFHPSTHGLLE